MRDTETETASVILRAAEGSEYIESLLERNGLPTEDVEGNLDWFYVGYADGTRVGIGGIERYGRVGLLRSVVVEQSVRGRGFGTALCAELETVARNAGVETLYVLTTTAAEFFAARGYVPVDRTTVPPAIEETTEFAELCPTTATCLKKSLQPS